MTISQPPSRGDVVLVDYPFSSGVGVKRRPALVVQNERDNAKLTNTIVAMITSRTDRASQPTQLPIGITRSPSIAPDFHTARRIVRPWCQHGSGIRPGLGRLRPGELPARDHAQCRGLPGRDGRCFRSEPRARSAYRRQPRSSRRGRGDNRLAKPHRLQDHVGQALVRAGQDSHIRGGQQPRHVVAMTQEPDQTIEVVKMCVLLEPPAQRAITDDQRTKVGLDMLKQVERPQQVLHPFLLGEAAREQSK